MSARPFAIYARAANGAIGRDGGLPWHLPADLAHFKALTMGHPMVMGRRTFESFERPLPGRRHIVLTRRRGWAADGAEVARDPDAALALAGGGEVAVIGGAAVFDALLPACDHIELTQIHRDYAGDTFMDAPDAEWRVVERRDLAADGDMPALSFLTYRRVAA